MNRLSFRVRNKVFQLHFQNWQIRDRCEGVKPEDCLADHPRGETLDKKAQAQSDISRDSEMKAHTIRYFQEMHNFYSKYTPLFQDGWAWPNKNEELWIRRYVSKVFVSCSLGRGPSFQLAQILRGITFFASSFTDKYLYIQKSHHTYSVGFVLSHKSQPCFKDKSTKMWHFAMAGSSAVF